jgi:hypothetical protein
MEILHRRHLALFLGNGVDGGKKPMLQRSLIDFGSERPSQPNLLNTIKVVLDSPSPKIKTSGNLTG